MRSRSIPARFTAFRKFMSPTYQALWSGRACGASSAAFFFRHEHRVKFALEWRKQLIPTAQPWIHASVNEAADGLDEWISVTDEIFTVTQCAAGEHEQSVMNGSPHQRMLWFLVLADEHVNFSARIPACKQSNRNPLSMYGGNFLQAVSQDKSTSKQASECSCRTCLSKLASLQ